MYTNRVFGTAKCVLIIEVSLFQGVLIEGFHCTSYIHVHATCTYKLTEGKASLVPRPSLLWSNI